MARRRCTGRPISAPPSIPPGGVPAFGAGSELTGGTLGAMVYGNLSQPSPKCYVRVHSGSAAVAPVSAGRRNARWNSHQGGDASQAAQTRPPGRAGPPSKGPNTVRAFRSMSWAGKGATAPFVPHLFGLCSTS